MAARRPATGLPTTGAAPDPSCEPRAANRCSPTAAARVTNRKTPLHASRGQQVRTAGPAPGRLDEYRRLLQRGRSRSCEQPSRTHARRTGGCAGIDFVTDSRTQEKTPAQWPGSRGYCCRRPVQSATAFISTYERHGYCTNGTDTRSPWSAAARRSIPVVSWRGASRGSAARWRERPCGRRRRRKRPIGRASTG